MTTDDWLLRRDDRRRGLRRHAAARRLHGEGVRRRSRARRPRVRPGRALRSTACAASIPSASSAGRSTRCRCSRSASCRCCSCTRCSASRAGCRSTRPTSKSVPPALVVQHRGQLRDEHELAELLRRVDDEPPHADGRARGAELRLGRGRPRGRGRADPRARSAAAAPRSATSGSTSTRSRRAHPAAARVRRRARAREPGRDPELLRQHRRRTRVQGATQTIPGGPVASQEAIKELGTNGGGFFNANSAHPFENPNGFTTAFEIFAAARDPVLAHVHVRQAGRRTRVRAGRSSRRCSSSGSRRPGSRSASRPTGNPKLNDVGVTQQATSRPAGRQLRGQGDPLRRRPRAACSRRRRPARRPAR